MVIRMVINEVTIALFYAGAATVIKGWEKNSSDKLIPKFCDLSATMDPRK